MSSGTDFKCDGLNDFTEKMYYKICKEYPEKADKLVDKSLGECKAEVIARTPWAEKKNKKYKNSKHLRDSWEIQKMNKPEKTFGALRNNAPHAHLIEYGHDIVTHGKKKSSRKVIGYAEGVHMLKNTMTHQQPKIDARIEKLVDEIFDLKE